MGIWGVNGLIGVEAERGNKWKEEENSHVVQLFAKAIWCF